MDRRSDGEPWVHGLARRLHQLAQRDQRSYAFAEAIATRDPTTAGRAFEQLIVDGFTQRGRALRLLTDAALVCLFRGSWPAAHRRAVLAETRQFECPIAAVLVEHVDETLIEADEESFKVPDYGESRPLTLGERRALARQPDRTIIDLAIGDPHPMVTAKLLDNPRLTEANVLRMAARRPVPARVLAEIGLHPKWRSRVRPATALVRNPHTPVPVALSLLPLLTARVVAELRRDAGIPAVVKELALLLLTETKT